MKVATQSVPVAYDTDAEVSAGYGSLYASTSAGANGGHSASPSFSRSTGATAKAARSSATRDVTDVMDDIFYTYTGVPSWAIFSHLQKEGAGLRQQLRNGAVFEHVAVQPALSPYLIEWARKLRALQAGRTSVAEKSSDRVRPSNSAKKQAGETADLTSVMDRELDLIETDDTEEEEEEDGLLPRWDDIEPTPRCGPAVLRAIRGAVRAYSKALLHLVTLSERCIGRWGHLSSGELRELHAAMAREKAAHVPVGFLFSAFTELNATGERLGNAVGALAQCDHLEVLRLNHNPGLTELSTLPPNCRVMIACGCHLQSFLSASPADQQMPSSPAQTYASLTTLGLAYNQLQDVQFIALLPALAVLDASFNYMTDIDAVVKKVAAHQTLAEVMFQGNPFSLLDTYRNTVVRGCVQLDELDWVAITSDERTLSVQRVHINDDRCTGEAAEGRADHAPVVAAAAASSRKTGHRRSATGNLTTLAITGTDSSANAVNDAVARGMGQTQRPRRSSAQRRSTASASASAQATLLPAISQESATSASILDEALLRTTVAAAVELLVLRGLSSFEPLVQTHPIEELMPASAFVYKLAGVGATPSEAPASSSAATVAASAVQTAPTPPPVTQHLFGSRKGKGAASAVADFGGRLGTSSPARGNNSGGGVATAGGKRAAAAPPLYEVTSRVLIEGCWGGDNADTARGSAPAKQNVDVLSEERSGVRVEFEIGLAAPPPTSPQRGGARHGGTARRASSASSNSAAKLRRKVAAAADTVAVPPTAAGGSGVASATEDPYIVSGATSDGAVACRHSSPSDSGVYAAQLPLTPTLVVAFQQPLLLSVTVEDTFRFVEAPVLKAMAEAGAPVSAHGSSTNRNIGGAPRGSRDGAAVSPDISPMPEAVLMSMLAVGPKEKKKETAEPADEAVVECQRRRIGVLRLNPFDLFNTNNDSSNGGGGGNMNGSSSSVTAVGPSITAPVSAPGDPSSSSFTTAGTSTLPCSRVLFLHNTDMEVDAHSIHAMQHELQQRQRQLREALFAYNALLEQYVEPACDGKGDPADVAFETAASPLATDAAGSAEKINRASNMAGAATPSPKPPSRSSRPSMSPQAHAHLVALHSSLKEQQASVVRQAVRIMALQSRLAELDAVTLSVDARLSIGRGPSPPPRTTVDAELNAVRYRRETPATRKGRPQPSKGSRR